MKENCMAKFLHLNDLDPRLRARIQQQLARDDAQAAAIHGRSVTVPSRTVNEKTGRITFSGPRKELRLVIIGQIRGGKNAVKITRKGKRYPDAKWAKWRDAAVRQIVAQLPADHQTITTPISVRLEYVAEDHRRRDQPAVLDAIFHVMERAGVVADDTLIWVTESSRRYDKENPMAVLTFLADSGKPA